MLFRQETFVFVKMAWSKVILYLSLLHRFSMCLCVNEVVLTSQNLPAPEDTVVNANVQKNFTEQFIRVKNESESSSRSASAYNSTEKADGEHWDFDQALKIWDPIVVSRIWKNDTYRDAGISLFCDEDLTRYLMGLSERANWALRSK